MDVRWEKSAERGLNVFRDPAARNCLLPYPDLGGPMPGANRAKALSPFIKGWSLAGFGGGGVRDRVVAPTNSFYMYHEHQEE